MSARLSSLNLSRKYSRQQAIRLSKSSSSRLSYLDRVGLVQPEKIGEGESNKPVVLYTQEQIEQIRLINQASQFLHMDAIRLAIEKQNLAKVVETLAKLFA